MTALLRRLARLLDRLRPGGTDPARRPLPAVTVETRPTLPGWALRLAVLLLTPALLLTAAGPGTGFTPPALTTVVTLATALVTLRPTPTTTGTVVVLAALLLWNLEPGPLDTTDLLTALLVAAQAYLLTRLTWWAAHVPLRGRAELAALTTGRRRDLTVLAGTALLGVLVTLASRTAVPAAVLLAALAVTGIALLALATGRGARDDGGGPGS